MPPPFTVAIGPSSGSRAAQPCTSFDSLTIKFNLTGGDTLGFGIAGNSQEAGYVAELASDVWLTGPDAARSQRFRVLTADESWDQNQVDLVALNTASYLTLLNKRWLYVPQTFSASTDDQGSIMWALIAYTQGLPGGNYGITEGTHLTGIKRDRTYKITDNIGQIISQMAGVIDGAVARIDGSLVYTATLLSAFATLASPAHIGATCRTLKRQGGAANFANDVYGTAGQGTTPVHTAAADIATDPRGRWETTKSWSSVKLQSTLVEHVDGYLTDSETPAATWTGDIEPARWLTDFPVMPGHFVNVVRPRSKTIIVGDASPIALVQVTQVAVTLTSAGALAVAFTGVELVPVEEDDD